MDLTRRLARLLRLKPGSRAAFRLRVRGEHALFKSLERDGLGAIERQGSPCERGGLPAG